MQKDFKARLLLALYALQQHRELDQEIIHSYMITDAYGLPVRAEVKASDIKALIAQNDQLRDALVNCYNELAKLHTLFDGGYTTERRKAVIGQTQNILDETV